MPNPYARLPPSAFWRTAIADKKPLEICELWKPKHPLQRFHKVATFGLCFAKYLRHALKARGYHWFDAELPPEFFPLAVRKKYNYHVFSARTGNIYTAAALRQWLSWSIGDSTPPEEVWQEKGRFFDPFRPTIEPDGFATPDELRSSRELVFRGIRNIVLHADWLVFTLGSTEGWVSSSMDYQYAIAPGIIAGTFDSSAHAFRNYTFEEITSDLNWVIETICKLNNRMRFLLTVSAVPLHETASGKHVLTATTFSQSVLRAVVGTMANHLEVVDYFPSYELITAPPFKGMFYGADQQSLSELGTAFVMDSFFTSLEREFGDVPIAMEPATLTDSDPRKFWANVLATRNALRGLI